jgi:hypothetical protein
MVAIHEDDLKLADDKISFADIIINKNFKINSIFLFVEKLIRKNLREYKYE